MSFPLIFTINRQVKYHHTLFKGQEKGPTGWIKILAHLGLRISVCHINALCSEQECMCIVGGEHRGGYPSLSREVSWQGKSIPGWEVD